MSLLHADDGKPENKSTASTAAPPAAQNAAPAADSKTFEVHVVGPDGKPVPHAKVDVRSTPRLQGDQVRVGKYQRRATYGVGITADADGRLVFTRPAGLKYLDFLLEMPGYAPYWTGWVPDVNSEPIPAELTIKLQSAWTVGSVVVDGDGQPIVGAEIWPVIEYAKGPGKTRQLVTGTHLRTDSNGRWSFDCAPDSVQAVQVEISKHDFMTLRTNLPRTKFGIKRGDKPAARVTLQAGLIVTGRVTDETGKPIAGAVVRTKFGNNVRKDVTSADGTYRVTGAEPGEARIVVSAKGRALEMKQVAIARGTNVDFILQPGRTVRVRVLDEKGHPLPRARIFFQRWRGPIQYFEFDSVTQYANKDGVWEWHEVAGRHVCRRYLSPRRHAAELSAVGRWEGGVHISCASGARDLRQSCRRENEAGAQNVSRRPRRSDLSEHVRGLYCGRRPLPPPRNVRAGIVRRADRSGRLLPRRFPRHSD